MAEIKRSGSGKNSPSNSNTGNNKDKGSANERNKRSSKRVYVSNARDARNSGRNSAGAGEKTGKNDTKGTSGNGTRTGRNPAASPASRSSKAATANSSSGSRKALNAGSATGSRKTSNTNSASGNRKNANPASSGKGKNSSSRRNAASNTRGTQKTSKAGKYEEYLKMTPDKDDSLRDEIGLVATALVCILMILSYLKLCGPFGDKVNYVLFGLFGGFGYVFPFALFAVVLFAISNKRNSSIVSKTIYCFLIMVDISALVQLVGGKFDKTLKLMEYFTNSQPGYAGPDKTYGGLFGGGFCKLLCPFLGKIATGCVFVALLFILLALILGKAIFTALTRRSMEGISNIRERQRIRREEETREYEEMLRHGENDGYYDEDDSEPGYEDESGFDDDHDSYNDEDEDEQDFEFPEHLMTSGRAAARNGERTVGYSDAERRRYLSKLRKEARKKQKAEGDSFLGRLLSKYKSGAGHIEDTPEYKEFKEKYGVSDHEMGEIIADALQKTSRRLGSETEYTEDDFTEDIEETGEHESSSGYSASDGYTGKDVEVTADAEEQDIVSRELDKKFGETKKIQVINLRERDRSTSDKPKHYFIDEDPDSAGLLDQDELDENLKRQIERFYDDDYPQENNGSSENDRNAENSDASGKDTDAAGDMNTAVHELDNKENLKKTVTSDKASETSSGNEPRDREVSGATGFNTPEQIKAVMEAAEEKKKNVPYEFPPYDLLKKNEKAKNVDHNELDEMVHKLQASLESFGVKVRVGDATCGPTVTRYEVYPEQGVKVKNITALTDDIKLALAVPDIRIEAPIPGKAAVGIEVPNKTRTPVSLRELIDSDEFRKVPSKLTCAIGKDIGGKIICADIAAMPHALVAGSTGSGKSVCINSMILSILYKAKPSEVRLILIDPKRVELVGYNGIPHLLVPVVTDVKKATGALNWAVAEMDDRYNRFADVGVSNLASYNRLMEEKYYEEGGTEEECPDRLPQILIIIDEFCDLMMTGNPKEVEAAVGRLTQLARACGIHLVIATQRPAVNVITGTIKANIPSRISFSLTSVVDSRTILDQAGAEKLLGKGDMLFSPQEYPQPVRLQGAYVSDKEIADVVKFVKDRCKENMYSDDVNKKIELSASQDNKGQTAGNDGSSKPQDDDDRDELFEEAGKLIIENKKASIGSIQRKYRLGFNRAARIMDQLAEAGVVGPEEGTKPRQILMTIDQFEAMLAGEDTQDQGEGE